MFKPETFFLPLNFRLIVGCCVVPRKGKRAAPDLQSKAELRDQRSNPALEFITEKFRNGNFLSSFYRWVATRYDDAIP